jgi:translation initiation factor 4G
MLMLQTARDITAAEKVSYNRQASTSRGGSRREHTTERNREFGPDSWAAQAAQFHSHLNPKAGDLSQFGKISKGAPIVTGSSSVFLGGIKDSNRESRSGKSLSSNMFHMLSGNPVLTHESSSTDIDLGQAGVPEPPVRRKQLQLIPRPKPTAEENTTAPSLDQNPEALALRKKLQLLPRFKPSVVARMPADIK